MSRYARKEEGPWESSVKSSKSTPFHMALMIGTFGSHLEEISALLPVWWITKPLVLSVVSDLWNLDPDVGPKKLNFQNGESEI